MPPSLARCPLILALAALPASAQWIHHHPTVQGYRAHHYFEGYELPVVANGVLDPAATPDGRGVVFASRGWLWRLDLGSGVATRLTSGAGRDARPALSPDGRQVAFVRDDNRTMWIVLKDLATGQERDLARSGRLDLDPAFTPDGRGVVYASTEAGDVDLWRVDVATGQRTRLTTEAGLEMKPQPLPDGRRVAYLHKTRPGTDQVRVLDLETGRSTVLLTGPILSQTRPSLGPDGHTLAVNLPEPASDRYYVALLDLDLPAFPQTVTQACARPLNPAWSPDGAWVYFAEDEGHTFALRRVPARGGRPETVPVKRWDYGVPMATLDLLTLDAATRTEQAARVEIVDGSGHPLLPDGLPLRFDPQSGRTYLDSPGRLRFPVPAGEVRVLATRGFAAAPASGSLQANPGAEARLELPLTRIWNPQAAGWYGGDTHFHINYGGPYLLRPEDLLPVMASEDLDAAMPMSANLHTRYTDPEYLGWKKADAPPLVEVGQEVRNHFLGHVGLIRMGEPFTPWFHGPGYPVTARADIPNAATFAFARRTGAFATYMHPYGAPDPFKPEAYPMIPKDMVADLVLGRADGLEVSCLWVNELGVSALWYRILNLGIPVVPMGGSDAFHNFYRCSTPGSNRVYVKVDGPCTLDAFYRGLAQGRVFVTSGPLLDFKVEGRIPGGVLPGKTRKAAWSLDVHSPVPVATVEILVNGEVVATFPGPDKAGTRTYTGHLRLPEGGWVAARVHGESATWPVMNSRTFAHTGPLWIGAVGSTLPAARRQAARELEPLLRDARAQVERTYQPAPIPAILAAFDEAQARLALLAAP